MDADAGELARPPEPIRVGFSMPLTHAIAVNGKQLLGTLEIRRDDVNARGGLREIISPYAAARK
jgi:hypothetical protein